ncbi:MAG: TetR/AcrR family transcriptional regulator [Acidimicrobiales bacterium]
MSPDTNQSPYPSTCGGEVQRAPRERILAAADRLLRYRGYEAVGVADICREAEVRKGSFYHFFDSKAALAVELLEGSWQRIRSKVFAEAFGQPASTIDTFHRFGELITMGLAHEMDAEGAISGCRFGNFALELANTDEAIRACVSQVFDEMAATFATAIESGQASGELTADLDPTATSLALLAHMEGLMLLAKTRRDPTIARTFGAAAEQLLR